MKEKLTANSEAERAGRDMKSKMIDTYLAFLDVLWSINIIKAFQIARDNILASL